jgi:hypothetical protein
MHPKEVLRLPSFCRAKPQTTLEDVLIQKEFWESQFFCRFKQAALDDVHIQPEF